VTVVRILIWNLGDSKTSLEELREQLPVLDDDGSLWIANEPQERIGLISRAEEMPDLRSLRALIGKEPDAAEEFDEVY
jgi:hypothetical protein